MFFERLLTNKDMCDVWEQTWWQMNMKLSAIATKGINWNELTSTASLSCLFADLPRIVWNSIPSTPLLKAAMEKKSVEATIFLNCMFFLFVGPFSFILYIYLFQDFLFLRLIFMRVYCLINNEEEWSYSTFYLFWFHESVLIFHGWHQLFLKFSELTPVNENSILFLNKFKHKCR